MKGEIEKRAEAGIVDGEDVEIKGEIEKHAEAEEGIGIEGEIEEKQENELAIDESFIDDI